MRRTAVVLAFVLAALFAIGAVQADDGPAVLDIRETADGGGLAFTIIARSSDAPVRDIRITIAQGRLGTTTTAKLRFDPANEVTAEHRIQRRNLVTGQVFSYWYLVEDETGRVVRTEPRRYRYLDPRFSWQSLDRDGLVVFFSDGGERRALLAADVADATFEEVGAALRANYPRTLTLMVYSSNQDALDAFPPGSQATRDFYAGFAFHDLDVVIFGVDSPEQVSSIVRHEVTHILTNERTRRSPNGLPAWLDEGLATYYGGGHDDVVLQRGIASGSLIPLRHLTQFTGTPERIDLAYAQSGSLIAFLIRRYGEASLADLLDAVDSGLRDDSALANVYGLDRNGIDAAWRASLGLAPEATPPAAPPAAQPGVRPPAATPPPAQPSLPGGRGNAGLTLAAVASLLVAAASGVGAIGMLWLLRRSFR